MKALTIWQPWASLIMIGAKPVEWRSWYAFRKMHGQRIVIHAGARKVVHGEVAELIQRIHTEAAQRRAGEPVDDPTGLHLDLALALLEPVLTGEEILPLSAGLGTAVMGEPRLAIDLGYPVDSDRLEMQNWGWPLTSVQPFVDPVACRGGRGFWEWSDAADMARRAA
jgi:hypothetical protein